MGRLTSIGFGLNSLTAGVEVDGTSGGGISISTTTTRQGGFAGRVTGITTGVRSAFVVNVAGGTVAINQYARFYVRFATLPNATTAIFDYVTGLGVHVGITVDTSGRLALFGGSVAGTLSPALATNTWYRVELHFDNSTAVGTHTVELRVDGVTVENSTANTNGNVATINFGANCRGGSETASAIDVFFADVAINDTSGSAQTSWPGSGALAYLYPAAAGDNAGFSIAGTVPAATNWQSVAEHPPDDGVTFVQRNTNTMRTDDYKVDSPSSLIGAADAITLVHVTLRCGSGNNTASTGRRLLTRIKSAAGGTVHKSAGAAAQATAAGVAGSIPCNVNGFVSHAVGTAPVFPRLVSYVDPTTGVAWTRDGTNSLSNMQIGMETEIANANQCTISAVWAIVEFVPSPLTVSDADTGAGVEAATAAFAISDTETASSSEVEALAATVSDSDTGAGVDTEAVAAALADDDAGVASDIESIAAGVSDDDVGAGTETEAVAVGFSDDDVAGGVDTEAVSSTVSDDDTAGADDQEIVSAALSDAESASAVDAGESLALGATDDDTATGVDSESVAVGATDADTAIVVDVEGGAFSIDHDDSASADELAAFLATLTDADTAVAVDAETIVFISPSSGAWLVGAVRL